MAGRSSSASACAATSTRTTGCARAWRGSTTFTGRTARGTAGREKAPAAICRKVIQAKLSGKHEINIWGSGNQTRSFMYIDDCLKGIQMIMDSEILEPINLGSSEMVSVNQLVDIVEDIAGIKLKRTYDLSAPKGVAGRNSDNTLIRKYLGWEPNISLRAGLEKTYAWIHDQYVAREQTGAAVGVR